MEKPPTLKIKEVGQLIINKLILLTTGEGVKMGLSASTVQKMYKLQSSSPQPLALVGRE